MLLGLVLSFLDYFHQVLVVLVQRVLKVHELKLRVFRLLRLDHDLHLYAVLGDEGCSLLNAGVFFFCLRLLVNTEESLQSLYCMYV